MRRLGTILVLVSGLIAASAGPVAADTTAGDYDQLSSFTSTCDTQGARTTCTEMWLTATNFLDHGFSDVCLETFTYAFNSRRGNLLSSEFGCSEVPAGSLTFGGDLSASLASVSVELWACGARRCDPSRTVEVSASDSPVGDASTSSSRSTIREGGCTTRTTSHDTFIPVSGTMTVDGVTHAQDGHVAQHREEIRVTCR